jgi:hypothetical protein
MHDEHSRSRSELWLARQLQDAARREQPRFSESLHRRIMQAVRSTAADPMVMAAGCAEPASAGERRNGASRRQTYWRSAAWLTSAAAILAMVIAGRWFAGSENRSGASPSRPAVAPSVAAEPGPNVKRAVETTATDAKSDTASPEGVDSNDIGSAVANYTLDDLTRDAQATAHVLVDQLPFETPAEEWGL